MQPVNSVAESVLAKAEGGKTEKSRVPGAARVARALSRGGGNNVKLGANVDRCALPTSWLDCFKSG